MMRPFLYLLLVNISLYAVSFEFVRHYYSKGLPYYDSVGSYWNMFAIANTTQQQGLLTGILQASSYSLSWLQSFFAVFASFVLPNTPEWMIILNFIFLFIAQYSIFIFVKNVFSSPFKAYLLSYLPLIPGALMGWVGGYIDMRRDSTFVSLLIAGTFLFLDYVYGKKPTVLKGIVVGIVWGLTQWSRGNALPYFLCVIAPVIAVNIFNFSRIRKVSNYFKILIIPIFFTLAIYLPFYYYNWSAVYEKYVFGSWGIGVDRIKAIYIFLRMIPILLVGPERNTLMVNTIFILGLSAFVMYLLKKKILKIDTVKLKSSRCKSLLIIGILIVTFMFIFNALILGVGGYLHPNFPVLVGVMVLVIYFISVLKVNGEKVLQGINKDLIISVWIVALLMLNAMRMYISFPPNQQLLLIQTKKASQDLGPILGGKHVSYIWLDHIHVHDLNFYITQAGGKPISAGSGLSREADTEMPPNPKRTIEEQQKAFAAGIRRREYIVVSQDTSKYEDQTGFFFILMHGKPVIDELLSDSNMEKIYSFQAGSLPFVVLRNKLFAQKSI